MARSSGVRYRLPVSRRRIVTAELLAVGTELTSGETRDTNAGDLAGELTALGVAVGRLSALPDDLSIVVGALRSALRRADLVVTTGGLGPTPDDLTREAIAAVCAEEPTVDPELVAWLEALFERRGRSMPAMNRKQAWLIPSATALPNERGTAPGWWVTRPDGRLIVALPGPPGEMRPMWRQAVLPRLRALDLGLDRASDTLRLADIGESDVAAAIGEPVLRRANPAVATYAREDAVDVRVSAVAIDGAAAADLLDRLLAELEPRLAPWIFARGTAGWPEAIASRLEGRRLATIEAGTAGRLAALLGDAPWLVRAELVGRAGPQEGSALEVGAMARRLRDAAGSEVALALNALERGGDTLVRVAVAELGQAEIRRVERVVFLAGDEGRRRAALVACTVLWRHLGGGQA